MTKGHHEEAKDTVYEQFNHRLHWKRVRSDGYHGDQSTMVTEGRIGRNATRYHIIIVY